ncbi:MAG: class I SAM-dependent methyltransferase [Bacteroidota bacterium]|nr:class I SAM-dependent methyltransferase [Bacteroidota bacterium]
MQSTAYYDIAYSQHEIMNPLTERTLSEIGRAFLCTPSPALLDIGSGKGYAAAVFAREFGAHCTLIEPWPRWNTAARDLFARIGATDRLTIHERRAGPEDARVEAFDVILCLGTTPVYGGFEAALNTLRPALRKDGILIVGEATLDPPVPVGYRSYILRRGWDFLTSSRMIRCIASCGYDLLWCRRSTSEEWDAYMSLQWKAVREYALAHAGEPDARAFLAYARKEQLVYFRYQRRAMDWNVLVLAACG